MLHNFSNCAVKSSPIRTKQCGIGSIPNKCMLKHARRFTAAASAMEKVGISKPTQSRAQFFRRGLRDRGQQRERELAPESGPDLNDVLDIA